MRRRTRTAGEASEDRCESEAKGKDEGNADAVVSEQARRRTANKQIMMPMDGEPEDVISTESSRTASKAKLVERRRNWMAKDTCEGSGIAFAG